MKPAERLTEGQQSALDDLRRIAAVNGAVQIIGYAMDAAILGVEISIDCSNIPHAVAGIRLRQRERLRIRVPPRFPFDVPVVDTAHTRWAGTPHVQWGRRLCLYQSTSIEWDPSDGMAGFISRLVLWLEGAAAGELDPVGAPLHPPVAYTTSESGLVVVRADAPRAEAVAPWLGVALLRCVTNLRVDLVGWREVGDPWPLTHGDALVAAGVGDDSSTVILALAVILPRAIAFEFPASAVELVAALATYGVDSALLLGALGVVASINRGIVAPAAGSPGEVDAPPLYLVVGSPSRGIVGAPDMRTHVAVWRLPPLAERIARLVPVGPANSPELASIGREFLAIGQDWLASAKTAWARVYEARSEIVTSRDADSAASWLVGKRILVLGAGALGAPIAEACVRGNAARVVVVDSGVVHPGILVRQPYDDSQIGDAKAAVLVDRLRRIHPDAAVEAVCEDVVTAFFDPASPPLEFDLVIDATADRRVRTWIERQWSPHRADRPVLATVLIGHEASRGIATVSYPEASGAAVDILRRLNLAVREDTTGDFAGVVEDFFPDPPRTQMFQPEPGCSDVTFVGSAADVTGLAGQMLTGVLSALAENSEGAEMLAVIVGMPSGPSKAPTGNTRWFRWQSDLVVHDADGRFEVRLAAPAVAEIRAEARRGRRVRGARVETGGTLLGGFDFALGVVWVDEATGPPPDSLLSEVHFEHGTVGVEKRIEARRTATARVTSFVGMWHTHPCSAARPSATDEEGMRDLVLPVGKSPPRALLLIAGGGVAKWKGWLSDATTPDWYARVVERAGASRPRGHVRPSSKPATAARTWPGGSRSPGAAVPKEPRPRMLRWLRQRSKGRG